MFHLTATATAIVPIIVIVSIGSLSFVGLGIMAATLPLLFTEKGAQMTYVIEACLLLVSGVYYDISVLPAWIQPFSHISPATYVLKGTRQVLLGHPSASDIVANLIPLIVIGVVTIPLGIWLFTSAQRFAKRTGRLKRTG
jgi:ABC-2 type transport system permease protein